MLKQLESRTHIKIDYNEYKLEDEELLIDDEVLSTDDIVLMINNKVDDLINQQVRANCVASVYLRLLKEYIIEHDYNVAGFKEHCMQRMNIQNSQFLNLSHSFGFRTVPFKAVKSK